MVKIPELFRGMIIGFCAGIIILGLVWGLVARRNKEKEILEYAEMQMELQTLWEDYRKRPLDEFLDDPAVRGAVDGASADFERKRDKLLQRFRSRITD